jgi:hypothetical protein
MTAFAVELHLFSSIDLIELPETLVKLKLQPIEFWRTFESFLQINNTMPVKLRQHFLHLEGHLIRFLCWSRSSQIVKVLSQIKAKLPEK